MRSWSCGGKQDNSELKWCKMRDLVAGQIFSRKGCYDIV